MVTADHGPAVSGAHNTIVCARAGKDLVSCLTSGLLTIVSLFNNNLVIFRIFAFFRLDSKRVEEKNFDFKGKQYFLNCFIFKFRVKDLVEHWMVQPNSKLIKYFSVDLK